MQDDCYTISSDGWKAETYRALEVNKKGKAIDKGWACDLIPKQLIVEHFFAAEQVAIGRHEGALESAAAQLAEMEEEHGGEDGAFAELDKVHKANVAARLKEIKNDNSASEEAQVLNNWLKLNQQEAEQKKSLAEAQAQLDDLAYARYPSLSVADIKTLVVVNKWMATIAAAIHGEMDRISQTLTQRVKQLAERYESPLPDLSKAVDELSAKVAAHLKTMGYEA